MKYTVLAICFLLMGCTRAESTKNDSTLFTFRLPSETPTVMPVRGIDNVSIDIMNNILEGLFEFDERMVPQPKLAEKFTVSPDGKTYHFWLRKNVHWSDGVEFTAQQIIDSWEMVLNSKSEAEYAYLLFPVQNAEKYHSGKLSDFSQVGIKAPNAYELVVTLKEPLAYFTQLLAVVVTFPMRVDLYKQFGEKWMEPPHVVSLASYILTKWEHDQEMTFEANPKYWGPAPKVRKVIARVIPDGTTALNLFESNKLDLVRKLAAVDIPRFAKDPRFFTSNYFRNYYLGFHLADRQVKDVRVRRALAMAIDRAGIIKVLTKGPTASTSFIPQGMLGYSDSVGITYDPTEAKRLAKEAGLKASDHFQLYYDQRDDNKMIMEQIQEQWKTVLGLNVELLPIEWKVYLARMRSGLGPMFRYGWGADFPDPDNFMTVFLSSSGNNFTGWKNAEYDKIILLAQHEMDQSKRVNLYASAQKLLLRDDVVIVPLFTESLNFVLQPKWKTIQFDAMTNLFFNRLEAR